MSDSDLLAFLHRDPQLITSLLTCCKSSGGLYQHASRPELQSYLQPFNGADYSGALNSAKMKKAWRVADTISSRIAEKGDASLLNIHYLSLRKILGSELTAVSPSFCQRQAQEASPRKSLLLSLADTWPTGHVLRDREDQLAAYKMIRAADAASNIGLDTQVVTRGTRVLKLMMERCEEPICSEIRAALKEVGSRPISDRIPPSTRLADLKLGWGENIVEDLRSAWSDSLGGSHKSDDSELGGEAEEDGLAADHMEALFNGLSTRMLDQDSAASDCSSAGGRAWS